MRQKASVDSPKGEIKERKKTKRMREREKERGKKMYVLEWKTEEVQDRNHARRTKKK